MTVATSTSFWSGVTATIGIVASVLSSIVSAATAGTITFVRLRQLNRANLRIDEFLSEVVARIEPSAESFRSIARSFIKRHDGFAGRSQAIVIDGEDGGDDLASVRVEDLNDVTVGRRI